MSEMPENFKKAAEEMAKEAGEKDPGRIRIIVNWMWNQARPLGGIVWQATKEEAKKGLLTVLGGPFTLKGFFCGVDPDEAKKRYPGR